MRESVSASKGVCRGVRCKERPSPDSKIGIVYSILMESPGLVLNARDIRAKIGYPEDTRGWIGWNQIVRQLNDFYELDVRRVGKNNHWCLVGKWDGSKYTDYVAARFNGPSKSLSGGG